MGRRRVLRILGVFVLSFWHSEVAQAQCSSFSIETTGVAFGTYDPLDSTNTTSTGTIEVNCSGEIGLEATYAVSLDRGFSGSYQPRGMIRGDSRLDYNFYTGAFSGVVWGDGTGGTQPISDLVTLVHAVENREYVIFGMIPPGQHVPSGIYSDSVVVTVTF